jgi:hypothetical protein
MLGNPFLILKVRGKKEILALRQKARLVAQLLRYEPYEQTCIAAGAFAVARQALAQMGKARICFQIEAEQLHIFAQGCRADGEAAAEPGRMLLRLAKPLPAERGLAEVDVAWLVKSMDLTVSNGLFEEVVKQNQEVLTLLHELQHCRRYPRPQHAEANDPHAA